jgi:hypothetical protein
MSGANLASTDSDTGFDGHLVKPASLDEITAMLEQMQQPWSMSHVPGHGQ